MSQDFRLELIKQLAQMRVEIHALRLAVQEAGIDESRLKVLRDNAKKDIHKAEDHFAANLPELTLRPTDR